jgi:hypothetical protein
MRRFAKAPAAARFSGETASRIPAFASCLAGAMLKADILHSLSKALHLGKLSKLHVGR